MVDPHGQRIIVYRYADQEMDFIGLFTFADKVSVGISDGTCEVDFAKIMENVGTIA